MLLKDESFHLCSATEDIGCMDWGPQLDSDLHSQVNCISWVRALHLINGGNRHFHQLRVTSQDVPHRTLAPRKPSCQPVHHSSVQTNSVPSEAHREV